ncbi:hypothetical protein CEXT_125831 [Caerostris extrusa]|uniref:Uncharacterized protein n=1 Tax=Caerostris extrusa TaxID=172846 RepID=A0AAV4QRD6_CAEEX|nr:hypothetical protein CEXT_125831 [Caerostris extrusa]
MKGYEVLITLLSGSPLNRCNFVEEELLNSHLNHLISKCFVLMEHVSEKSNSVKDFEKRRLEFKGVDLIRFPAAFDGNSTVSQSKWLRDLFQPRTNGQTK